MQNPAPDAPPGRTERQDAELPNPPVTFVPGAAPAVVAAADTAPTPAVVEIDGPSGPEPTRYGDWERKGRCIDF